MRVRALSLTLSALLVAAPLSVAAAEMMASFSYSLSNFEGPVPSQWARLAVDPERDEIYALNRRKNDIRIFDEHGMEIFVFGEGFFTAADITIGDDGSIFLLSTGYQSAKVDRLNYRGEHVSEVSLKNLPARLSGFVPDQLLHRHRSLYLVESNSLRVVVVDTNGYFQEAYDLNTLLKPFLTRNDGLKWKLANVDWRKRKLEEIELHGFTVDSRGNIFFTVPVLFSAFRLSPAGQLDAFGRSGSGPGKFGVVSGIVTDDDGYVYVADRLRSVVLVFDPDLRFQAEFGYRGAESHNLIVPDDLAIDSSGKIYVGQAANRGVSVFRIIHETTSSTQTTQITETRTAGPSRVTAIKSTVSEKSGQTVEDQAIEDQAIEAYVPDREEFIADHGVAAAPRDLAESDWTIEESESHQSEDIGNAEQ
jgi:DNA-binding beta-propeller fold protein YncE